MTRLLLDTHVWVWSMFDSPRLNQAVRRNISQSTGLFVSPVSLYEIAQKVRLGNWADMAPYVRGLPERLVKDGVTLCRLDAEVCLTAGLLNWDHRDPFDRMIAATAPVNDLTLVSADAAFDTVPGGLAGIW